ncbi:MAG TPA: hypothetical protein VF851_00325 [Steroidobacteraceae bacterium]
MLGLPTGMGSGSVMTATCVAAAIALKTLMPVVAPGRSAHTLVGVAR